MEYQFLIPIFAIIFGTVLTGLIFWWVFDLIKSWINRNNASVDDEQFERMAKAFIQHKKDTERRLENLEAIVTDDEPVTGQQLDQTSSVESIEIDNENDSEQRASSSGQLNNMLKNRT